MNSLANQQRFQISGAAVANGFAVDYQHLIRTVSEPAMAADVLLDVGAGQEYAVGLLFVSWAISRRLLFTVPASSFFKLLMRLTSSSVRFNVPCRLRMFSVLPGSDSPWISRCRGLPARDPDSVACSRLRSSPESPARRSAAR